MIQSEEDKRFIDHFSRLSDDELFLLYRSPEVSDHERELMSRVSPFIRDCLTCDRAIGRKLEEISRGNDFKD